MATSVNSPDAFAPVLAMSRYLSRVVADATGLSLTDFRVLRYVIAHDGQVQNNNMSEALSIARSTSSMSIASLVGKGLVRQQDAKARTLHVTLSGRWAFDAARNALHASISSVLSPLRSDVRDTANFYMGLIADQLGATVIDDGVVDLTLVYVEANARVKRILKASAAQCDLSPNGFVVMEGIAAKPEGVRPSALAKRLRMRKPDITNALASLDSKGYVVAEQDSDDARGKKVHATARGIEALNQAVTSFWRSFNEQVRALRPEELEFFRTLNAHC